MIYYYGDRSFLPDELFEDDNDDKDEQERLLRVKSREWVDDEGQEGSDDV